MRTRQINTGKFIINGAAVNYAKMIIMVGKGWKQRRRRNRFSHRIFDQSLSWSFTRNTSSSNLVNVWVNYEKGLVLWSVEPKTSPRDYQMSDNLQITLKFDFTNSAKRTGLMSPSYLISS